MVNGNLERKCKRMWTRGSRSLIPLRGGNHCLPLFYRCINSPPTWLPPLLPRQWPRLPLSIRSIDVQSDLCKRAFAFQFYVLGSICFFYFDRIPQKSQHTVLVVAADNIDAGGIIRQSFLISLNQLYWKETGERESIRNTGLACICSSLDPGQNSKHNI